MTHANPNIYLSLIIPLFNEEDAIPLCYQTLCQEFDSLYGPGVEFIFIDDGSQDRSFHVLKEISAEDSRVKCLRFTRNFGKEAAMTAGLQVAQGQYTAQIDADLQDPPALVPEMIAYGKAHQLDVVYGVRREREGETFFKKATSFVFYKFIHMTSDQIKIPRNTGDFRVMSRPVVNALRELPERQRFMKGLFAWVGFSQGAFYYTRKPRVSGTTKFNYIRLWNFALEGITSFTTVPLKLATYFGFFISTVAFFLMTFYVLKYFILGDKIQGFLTIMVTLLFTSGLQLMFLGIIGEYLGRTYLETKNRPLYLLRDKINL